MSRQHICDVPGCGQTRLRKQRICDRCFRRLPGEIRLGIKEAHHQRRWADHTALKRRAAAFLNLPGSRPTTPATPTVSPQRAYELQARMLGERTDA